jgi:hypothetical protein
MAPDDIRYSTIKEDRGWYFVEYFPPLPNYRFSTLQVSILEPRDAGVVADAIESEAKLWLARYPVPLMATAFSLDGNVLTLRPARPIDHLLAWPDVVKSTDVLRWELVPDEVLPAVALDRNFLRKVFSNIPCKTGREIQNEAAKHVAGQKFGWWLVFLWAVVVPLSRSGFGMVERPSGVYCPWICVLQSVYRSTSSHWPLAQIVTHTRKGVQRTEDAPLLLPLRA